MFITLLTLLSVFDIIRYRDFTKFRNYPEMRNSAIVLQLWNSSIIQQTLRNSTINAEYYGISSGFKKKKSVSH